MDEKKVFLIVLARDGFEMTLCMDENIIITLYVWMKKSLLDCPCKGWVIRNTLDICMPQLFPMNFHKLLGL